MEIRVLIEAHEITQEEVEFLNAQSDELVIKLEEKLKEMRAGKVDVDASYSTKSQTSRGGELDSDQIESFQAELLGHIFTQMHEEGNVTIQAKDIGDGKSEVKILDVGGFSVNVSDCFQFMSKYCQLLKKFAEHHDEEITIKWFTRSNSYSEILVLPGANNPIH